MCYFSFTFMLFGSQILMLRWRNSRGKMDLVFTHLVTCGSHTKCVEASSHQCFSNLSSQLLVSETNRIHSKQLIWYFTKKTEENEQHLLVQGQVWLFPTFCCFILPLDLSGNIIVLYFSNLSSRFLVSKTNRRIFTTRSPAVIYWTQI